MTTYPLWADIPPGVTVYVPNHELLAIKLENATLVSITENKGRAGWIQTTGRLKGPFEDVYGGLVSLEECIVPKPAPRQWQSLQDVPKGVQVRDIDGDRWKRKKGAWHYKEVDTWYSRDTICRADDYRPFTEIVK
ncbi:hypothetical protein [Mycobacteroides abscessus]|uniref:hypothetical protein n=1 Tax=Mycobacteroides abscessus TaxID=36809 RepID=UPI000376D67F|nr:hypothetical protein [Mycobacteroides abscessus]